MNNRKLLPLGLAAAAVLLLALALLALSAHTETEEDTGIPLFSFGREELSAVSWSGNSVEITLLRGKEGSWMLDSDPTLPLDQAAVESQLAALTGLTARRTLAGEELTALPDRAAVPLITLTATAGETVRTLEVDQLNTIADVYYVYDDSGVVYTADHGDVDALLLTAAELYAPQSLTDHVMDDVLTMQVNDLSFTQTDGVWTMTDEPDTPLDQTAVDKMANTFCTLKSGWSVTSPGPDEAYGLDNPDVTVTLVFSDGSSVTARFGGLCVEDETLCYLAADSHPAVVLEVPVSARDAYAPTRESLYDHSTPETAANDIIAEHPVG